MSDEGRRPGLAGQILAAVVIALVVGGSAPWWWDKFFSKPAPNLDTAQAADHGGNSNPSAGVQEPAPAAPAAPATPEELSRTEHSLAGDTILDFHLAARDGRKMTINVDYSFNPSHQRVMVGAWLQGEVSSGYVPVFVPDQPQGTAPLEMTVNNAGSSRGIEIFLYESGRPAEKFARRVFPYETHFD